MKKNRKKIIKGNIYKNKKIQKPQEKGGQGGWVLGWFAKEPFKNKNFEIKLGDHNKGKKKKIIGFNKKAKTFAVLIEGKMQINFYKKTGVFLKSVILEKPGDFVFYEPGVPHDWRILAKCRSVTVRWPSIKNDQKELK